MSLINDMLRDLDKRRTQPAGGNITALPTAGTCGMEAGMTRQGVAWLIAGISLLSAIAIIAPQVADYLADSNIPRTIVPATSTGNDHPAVANMPAQLADSMADSQPAIEPAPVETRTDAGHVEDLSTHREPGTTDTHAVTSVHANNAPDGRPEAGITLHAPSSRQSLARAYRDAITAAGTGKEWEAIHQLENILGRDDDHHDARVLLASLYIRQQHINAAESLLASGLARHTHHAPYARLLARLLVTGGRYQDAIEHMQTALPGATRDAEYHALLAGLYQRTGEPGVAARHYTIALELSPGRGEWWMGLGISREQEGDSVAAQTAYREALKHPLDSLLQQYIHQRLQQLPPPLHGDTDKTQGKV